MKGQASAKFQGVSSGIRLFSSACVRVRSCQRLGAMKKGDGIIVVKRLQQTEKQ